jgi:[ribosomal protein S18]-alanine N-acetyltransferase
MTWQLRRAGEADLDAIMAIETATFPADAWAPSLMRDELRSPHTYYLVAERVAAPHEVEGYGGVLAPRGGEQADIQTIAVAETARRRGLGRTILLALLAEAARRGAQQTFLEVRVDNPSAQALYESEGFETVGRRPRYYQPEGVDALVMRRETPVAETRLTEAER